MEAIVESPSAILQAVEISAVVDEKHNLRLDAPLPEGLAGRVRVIVIAQPVTAAVTNGKAAPVEYDTSELTDEEWLRAASILQAKDFEDDPPGDVYTIKDGKPIRAKI